MNVKKAGLVAGAFLVGIWYFVFYRTSPEQEIARRFESAVSEVEKESGEGNIMMVAKHESLSMMLDDSVRIFCVRPGIDREYDVNELMSDYALARRYCKRLKITYSKPEVTLLSSERARLTCLVHAEAEGTHGGSVDESRPAEVYFVKKDDKWLISEVREHKVFK